ncbi:hypothetical protein BV20DRAFT_560758 [Pilatotrama ljubarskyi]|nr:hypothetical protein BV20DRAFT_560758 [Pilatotrama ljubarskyi]
MLPSSATTILALSEETLRLMLLPSFLLFLVKRSLASVWKSSPAAIMSVPAIILWFLWPHLHISMLLVSGAQHPLAQLDNSCVSTAPNPTRGFMYSHPTSLPEPGQR